MTRSAARIIFIAFCFFAAAAAVRAADPPMYNAGAETTITGVVVQVVSQMGVDGAVGVHLSIKTSRGLETVVVAPALFIGQNNFWFQTDDRLSIIGAPLAGRTPVFLARAITKTARILVLRDEHGVALWEGADDGLDGCGVNHMGR